MYLECVCLLLLPIVITDNFRLINYVVCKTWTAFNTINNTLILVSRIFHVSTQHGSEFHDNRVFQFTLHRDVTNLMVDKCIAEKPVTIETRSISRLNHAITVHPSWLLIAVLPNVQLNPQPQPLKPKSVYWALAVVPVHFKPMPLGCNSVVR